MGVWVGEVYWSYEFYFFCVCIEWEREFVLNVLKDGVWNVIGVLNVDVEFEKGIYKDVDESDVFGNIECGCCFLEYRFEEMV